MQQTLRRAALLQAFVLTLAACSGAPPAANNAPLSTATGSPAPLAATAAPAPSAPARGTAAALGITLIPAKEPPPVAPTAPPRATPGALPDGIAAVPHVQQAITDLAARLVVDPGAVKVLRAEEVDWPDGSLGCPRDDMSYTQAIVNGVFVQLEAGGQTYNYHGRSGDAPFLCTSKRGITPDTLPPELRGGGGEDK